MFLTLVQGHRWAISQSAGQPESVGAYAHASFCVHAEGMSGSSYSRVYFVLPCAVRRSGSSFGCTYVVFFDVRLRSDIVRNCMLERDVTAACSAVPYHWGWSHYAMDAMVFI